MIKYFTVTFMTSLNFYVKQTNFIFTIDHLLKICQEGIIDNNTMLDVENTMTKNPGSGFSDCDLMIPPSIPPYRKYLPLSKLLHLSKPLFVHPYNEANIILLLDLVKDYMKLFTSGTKSSI